MSDSDDDEDFMAAKMASMLSNYYGTAIADPATDDDSAGDGGGRGGGGLGGGGFGAAQNQQEDIDSSSFDPAEYAINMLQNESLAGLLDRDATLVREIKSIDTDMKMLVHENYKKFIFATDTIRSMRHNVDEMEEKMEELKQDMSSIYEKAEEITCQLAPTRNKIEKLVSVRQLLKKLEFLFELPLRLSRSIELKAYAQAVKYYSTARGVLNDHLDVPSFRNILVEADAIISKLKSDIQTWIQEDDITASKLAQYIKLLISLDEDASLLHVRYVEWHRRRLKWMLHRHSSSVVRDELNRPDGGWPYEAMPADEYVVSLKKSVVQGFVDMSHMYVGIFGNAGFESGELHPDLGQLGNELFGGFFSLCKKKILSTSSAVAGEPSGGGEAAAAAKLGHSDEAALDTLSAALQGMQQCAQLMHQVVPKFRAHDRLAETLENAIRHRIEEIFMTLHSSTVERLLRASAAVAEVTADGVRQVATAIVKDVADVLASLRPLVEIGTDIMSDMPRIFSDLVQGQLHGYFLWFHNVLESLTENSSRSAIIAESDQDAELGFQHHNFDVDLPIKPHVDGSSADVALLLACICQRVEAEGVSNAMQMLTDNLPHLKQAAEAGGGGMGAGSMVDIPDLIKRARQCTTALLDRYVHLLVDRLAEIVHAQFDAVEWLQHPEPREVSEYCSRFFAAVGVMVDDIRRITGTEFDLCTIPRRPVFKVPGKGGAAAGDGGGGAEPGIRLNIERLFTQRLSLYEGITFAPDTIISAALTAALKTLFETARLKTFAKFGYQQAQVDASFLRVMLPRFGVKLDAGLDALIDEFVSSVHDRCIAPLDVDVAVVDSLISDKRDELGV